ncbi:MAG TPA: glycosyltransferase family 39 protein [Candidatus Bathyarchaeia archaeon]|nr:glycosyltransferase family 39 protein [Candidatus Bathyarchaeia archaeon]
MRAERWAQAAVLLLALLLRLWRLDQNGFDNEYYAAGVRSMLAGWHPFFYNAYDPAGFVSVDKPPLALWIQVASARLWGFGPLALLLPQVLEGVAAVAVLVHLVGRRFGALAGVLAGLFLALTPIAVASDRSGNTDSALVLLLLLAAWALVVAVERGSLARLLLAMALIGLAFNVKMLAAFVVLPTFALVYWLGAPAPWRRRLVDLVLSGVVVAAVSLSWTVAYDLTPPARRPFAGSTASNSMIELAVGHNGVGRFVRTWQSPRTARAAEAPRPSRPPSPDGVAPPPITAAERYSRLFVRTPVGPLRLLDGQLAAQVEWLLPLALVGLGGLLGISLRPPLPPAGVSLLLWAGWALTYAAVYSYAGGIFHFYYLATLGPPLAAVAAVGVAGLWERYRRGGAPAALLPAALLLTALWQGHVQAAALPAGAEDWMRRLPIWILAAAAAGAITLLVVRFHGGAGRPASLAAGGALAVGLAALLIGPTAWALSSVLVRGVPVLPSADLARLPGRAAAASSRTRARLAEDRQRLREFLQANRHGERFLLATQSAQGASGLIVATGEPVMAMGGYHGLDPILTPESLARMVEERQVRFVLLGELTLSSRTMGAEAAGRPLADWVRAHGAPVEAARWSGPPAAGSRTPPRELYDLNPSAGLAPAP